MNKINWINKFCRGETLLEVMVALFVVVMGSATATNLIVTSLQANNYSRDSLVALNLAQQGVEFIRNQRDTNFLRYSGNTKACWNVNHGADACLYKEDYYLKNKYYILGKDENGVANDFDLSNGIDDNDKHFRLYYMDLDSSEDSDGNGNNTDDKDVMYGDINGQSEGGGALTPSKFFMSIYISYNQLNSENGSIIDGAITEPASPEANMMTVKARVAWMDGSMPREVVLNTALTQYK